MTTGIRTRKLNDKNEIKSQILEYMLISVNLDTKPADSTIKERSNHHELIQLIFFIKMANSTHSTHV